MQKNRKRLRIGTQDEQLRNTTVEGLGSLVGTLLQLARI